MTSLLDKLTGPNLPLTKEAWDKQEVQGLIKSGTARLTDAKQTTLSLEGRFDLAYNAAHALSLAALRSQGYRAKNRYIVFQVLPQTLGLGPEVWRVLAKCHDIRNLGEYEGLMNIDDRLVQDLIETTQKVLQVISEREIGTP